ncbi:hypothetical protein NEUTE1DRAFT_117590, partial [Neurospora tetrasperma FGSC 2508]
MRNGIGRAKLCCSRRMTSRLLNLDLISNQSGKAEQGIVESTSRNIVGKRELYSGSKSRSRNKTSRLLKPNPNSNAQRVKDRRDPAFHIGGIWTD